MTTNENKKSKKSAKQKKILVASVVLAGLIVAGGTFAWFTSKDEVTNTLTAKNDYNVVITETFKSPDNWIPGEEVNKDVSVLNAGSIDAFARVKLTDKLSGTVYDDGISIATGTSLGSVPPDNAIEIKADEAKAMQAGGKLVSATDSTGADLGITNTNGTEFIPTATGFYVFQRTSGSKETTTDLGDYVGYVYDGTNSKYYAVKPVTKKDNEYKTSYKSKKSINATGGLSTSSSVDTTTEPGKAFIKSTYTVGGKTLVFKIYLKSDYAKYWTLGSDGMFYYKKNIAAGAITETLVDSVVLDQSSTADYADIKYDLKVNMDSVQVAPGTDETDKQASIPVDWQVKPTVS